MRNNQKVKSVNPGKELLRKSPGDMHSVASADVKALVCELQVYQVELEIQNEELRNATLELEVSQRRA